MTKLIKYKFSDLYEMGSGISTSKEQAGHGYPFAAFSTVINNYFLPDTLPDLMDTTEEQRTISSILEGDILITRTSETPDELAMSCVALKDYPNATFSGFVKRLRPKNKNLVYPKYMAFYLRGPYFRKLVNSNTVMTLRASFNEHIFNFMDIYLPSYETQKQIGDLLYKIEQKINVNNKINDNLHRLATMIYMQMFYGKKANGKLEDILIENPKSIIQVNERKGKQGQLPFFTSGEAILNAEIPIISGRNCYLSTGGNANISYFVGDASYSTDTWCITAKNNLSDYMYLMLNSIKLEINKKFFQGTGLKHLQKHMLRTKDIYIPTQKELNIFNNLVNEIFTTISKNFIENKQLKCSLNYLLPLLINGQVSIN